ncbi:HET-domain-containing protein [Colletotrichum caudatum]|nr:HET-domain-containing protein [Colletotrichum caudatum]
MSTWTARTAKEPVGAAASSVMAPSRRASSASTTTASKFNPVGRVREWLDTCNAEHGDHCSGPPGDTWRPIWLIDSVNRCLVRARATDRYIALSYVYEPPLPSSRGPVETLRGNLEMLTASMDDADVPQTILDAMWLARKLGIKYLWVDRFCIVQDDDVEREEHVKNMAYVYANAYLTIVAAMGDAETGLTGLLRRTPPPRGAASRRLDDLVLSSRWAGRAWTVQEGMYSRRKVYVFEETVTWECHCDVWQGPPAAGGGGRFSKILKGGGGGAGRGGPCQQRDFPAATGYLHPVWPDMDEYARIAMEFSARRVTLMSDTTRALRGITTVLSRSFAGGFIFGMPVSFLDVAMLWQPRAMVRRRMMVQPMTGMNPLPSWSWLGWHYDGVPADLTLWRAAADYVQDAPPSGKKGAERRFKSPYAFRLRSLVSYELTDRATYTPLPNDGMAYRDRRHRRAVPLPAGWSRSNGGFRYAGDPEVMFRYPVPVAEMTGGGGVDGGGAVGGSSPFGDFAMSATLLSFSTTMAFLEVDFATARNGAPVDAKAANAVNTGNNAGPAAGLVAPGRGYGVPLAIGNIWSRTGKWCGVVTAHDSWLGLQGANHTGEERLEFVAVSMASERGGSHVFDLDAFRDNMDEDEIVDFVNVLWVERVGGVCYRRGLGHVVQRVWDAVARDRVDVLLG